MKMDGQFGYGLAWVGARGIHFYDKNRGFTIGKVGMVFASSIRFAWRNHGHQQLLNRLKDMFHFSHM